MHHRYATLSSFVTTASRSLWLIAPLLLTTVSVVADEPQDTEEPDLRIMSFNIRYGTADDGENRWENRKDLVFDVIRRREPDIVGLQEALRFQIDEIRATLPAYEEIGVGRDDGEAKGEYSAILYRGDRFDVIESETFWFSDTPDIPGSMSWGNAIPRICTWARLRDEESGDAFSVYNVHLDHRSQESRERSTAYLLEYIRTRDHLDDPVIVTGDFNAGEQNPAMLTLTSTRDNELTPPLRDTFRIAHPNATGVGTFCGFRGETGGEKIDYVLVTPDVDVLKAEIVRDHEGERYPSDHFPVSATVRLK